MQDKFDNLQDINYEIGTRSLTPDLLNYAIVTQEHYQFFKPMIDVRKLLHHVVRGEHDAVKQLLEQNIHLIFQQGNITDCSGRTFEHISAFEYALWALDEHMWKTMLECIPNNTKGKAVLVQLLAQYHQINTEKVTYSLNGKTITEMHFDFENTIIRELQIQVNSLHAVRNWNAIDKQWRQEVGGAQKLLPMHVIDEYCSNVPFVPVPQFTSRPKSSRTFYNWTTQQYEHWFDVASKLGSHFAIYKVQRQWAVGDDSAEQQGIAGDLVALKELFKIRTKAFNNLKSELEKMITVNNQPQVLRI